jgi:hypothetical protein
LALCHPAAGHNHVAGKGGGNLLHVLRRVGIAFGSLVAAALVMWLVGGLLLPFLGVPYRPLDPTARTEAAALVGLVTLVLGALIYRDIFHREGRRP